MIAGLLLSPAAAAPYVGGASATEQRGSATSDRADLAVPTFRFVMFATTDESGHPGRQAARCSLLAADTRPRFREVSERSPTGSAVRLVLLVESLAGLRDIAANAAPRSGVTGRGETDFRLLGQLRTTSENLSLLSASRPGGRKRNRTAVRGFAVLCITTLPSGRCRSYRRALRGWSSAARRSNPAVRLVLRRSCRPPVRGRDGRAGDRLYPVASAVRLHGAVRSRRRARRKNGERPAARAFSS